jgi:hypothetical protein
VTLGSELLFFVLVLDFDFALAAADEMSKEEENMPMSPEHTKGGEEDEATEAEPEGEAEETGIILALKR